MDQLFEEWRSDPAFQLFPLTYDIALEGSLIGLRDPADRTIVATARIHHLALVTSDRRIIDSRSVRVID